MLSLAGRMKVYEKTFQNKAMKNMPLIIRVDGKAFHTFTRHCVKPFDRQLQSAMINSAKEVAENMQGFKVAYVQSDEVTFCLTDYDSFETEGWFDYELPKIISISASLMTAYFNLHYSYANKSNNPALFDSRAFSIPKEEIVNMFLWRSIDWHRNSLQMYARSFFSHKELHKKNADNIHDMLHHIGKNWSTDLDEIDKNGVFLINHRYSRIMKADILPSYESINEAIKECFDFKSEE